MQATREIVGALPGVQVVVLTTYDTDDLVFSAVQAGAQAYVLKDSSSEALATVIRQVHRGESVLDPVVARKVMEEFRRLGGPMRRAAGGESAEPTAMPLEALTEREAEVLALADQGKSNRAISEALHLSEGTVKNYISRVMAKLQAADRTQMILIALRASLVRL